MSVSNLIEQFNTVKSPDEFVNSYFKGTNVPELIKDLNTEILKNKDETFSEALSKVSDNDKYKDITFINKTQAYFMSIFKNFPKEPYDQLEYVRRFQISNSTLHFTVIITSCILLALHCYVIYTTYQLSSLINNKKEFSSVSSSNSNISYVTMLSTVFYLLIFVYLLRNKADSPDDSSYRPELIRYFLNLNLVLMIILSSFSTTLSTNINNVSYNSIGADTTTLPSAKSIQSNQSLVVSIITWITVLSWIYCNALPVSIDLFESGLKVSGSSF